MFGPGSQLAWWMKFWAEKKRFEWYVLGNTIDHCEEETDTKEPSV